MTPDDRTPPERAQPMQAQPVMANAFSPADRAGLDAGEAALVARRERVLGPAYRLFYRHPVHPVRGEGAWLHGSDGRAYLDAYNNVACVGHAHPRVVDAIARQAALLNTHTRYLDEGVLAYAERLVSTFPAELSQVMFTCTGSEANDLAWRVARQATGGTGVIVTTHAYHGVTAAVAAFSPSLGPAVPLGPEVRTVPPPGGEPAGAGVRFGEAVAAAAADLSRNGIRPAMLVVDTVFSSDGVVADPVGLLAPAAAAIRAAGGLFVADEVQPGFGRLGASLWGFERHGVVPDLVTLGKPMGNGYPVAALVGWPDHLDAFGRSSRYFNTFGGTPVAMAAAGAVLDVIEGEGLVGNAARVGRRLREGLEGLAATSPLLGETRGAGLFLGVDVVEDGHPSPARAATIVNALRERLVLVSASGPHAATLKIRPPLVFSAAQADLLVERLKETLAASKTGSQ